MTDVATTIPSVGTPIIEANGRVNEVWFRFFYTLLLRTGDESGGNVDDLAKRLALLLQRFVGEQAQQQGVVAIPAKPDGSAPAAVGIVRLQPGAVPDTVPTPRPIPADVPAAVALLRAPPAEAQIQAANHGQHYDPGLHAVADATNNGFMSAADKAKLDGIAAYGDPNDWAQVAKASLPTPSTTNKGWRRFVTDATGATGIIPAYCTGTAWKRFADDSTVN